MRFIPALFIFMGIVVFLERSILSIYGHSDFFVFYQSVRFYLAGQDLYSPYIIHNGVMYIREAGNLNAPFLTLLLLPLGIFNYAQAYEIWTVTLTACILVGGYLALRPFPQWHKYTFWVLLFLLLFFPDLQTLIYGQLSPILLVIVTAAWLLSRENKDIPAGVLIGLACALKLFCGLFLIYFLCIKRYRMFTISLLTFLGAFGLAWFVFGTQAYVSFYHSMQGIFWYAGTWNVSLHGFFMRLFSNEERNIPLIVAPQVFQACTMGLSGLLLGYLLWFWRNQGQEQFDRGFALVIVSMLLLSPLSWIYYFSLLIIPYLIILSDKNDWTHLAASILLLLSMKIPLLTLASGIKTPAQIFWAGGLGVYVLCGLLVLLAKPYPAYQQFSPTLWRIVYALIFAPALIMMVITFFSLTFGHRL